MWSPPPNPPLRPSAPANLSSSPPTRFARTLLPFSVAPTFTPTHGPSLKALLPSLASQRALPLIRTISTRAHALSQTAPDCPRSGPPSLRVHTQPPPVNPLFSARCSPPPPRSHISPLFAPSLDAHLSVSGPGQCGLHGSPSCL